MDAQVHVRVHCHVHIHHTPFTCAHGGHVRVHVQATIQINIEASRAHFEALIANMSASANTMGSGGEQRVGSDGGVEGTGGLGAITAIS